MAFQGAPLATIQQPGPQEPRRQHEVLSLDQIRALRSANEYTEGPSVAARRPPGAPRTAPAPGGHGDKRERTHQTIRLNNNNDYDPRPPPPRVAPGLSRSTSTGSSGSGASVSSERGPLLARSPPPPVRTQPKPKGPLLLPPPPPPAPDCPGLQKGKGCPSSVAEGPPLPGPHQVICERCAKCKCGECTAPRGLPSCLACHGQCLCSPESALEHGTCMCLVKGAFYHCSADQDDGGEGDSCAADQPCSLSRSHCCGRFLCMGLASLALPCLLCYPPVKGCLRASQSCHDRRTRPGCRCRSSNAVYRSTMEAWPSHKPS
ncbi:hypothetical protein NHX12_012025 [Muraenolepis orangiensis]|uniref:Protein sprouty homolog 1 n=1 Tax=Muraenolepis orangiensis TaxID=630683 RepID=A0A9Q0I690_9TELE|nr:hypothetical protein NHX12_012025 [Muraenolepis orangiensis]